MLLAELIARVDANIVFFLTKPYFDAAATVTLSKRSASAPEAHEPLAQKGAVAALLSMTLFFETTISFI